MKTVEIICSICPNNCVIQAELNEDEVMEITGNGCMRGYAYAQQEVLNNAT